MDSIARKAYDAVIETPGYATVAAIGDMDAAINGDPNINMKDNKKVDSTGRRGYKGIVTPSELGLSVDGFGDYETQFSY
jgi:hypothetical protein